VAPHDREDARLDDELAQEREDTRRGDVRALRRRTREDDYDDEEEFEDARVPRRARAAQGPRRPDRDPRTGLPDNVYPRQPGRGWEDEPERPAAHLQSSAKPSRRIEDVPPDAISPGPTRTPGMQGVTETDDQWRAFEAQLAAQVPLGRVADPEEIGKAAVFLASDDSSFVNGVELFVDGGMAQI
jgi:hypothetical protein